MFGAEFDAAAAAAVAAVEVVLGGIDMYEKLADKKAMPTEDEFVAHMGAVKEFFENIDSFLMDELQAEKGLHFDGHSQCWSMAYHVRRKTKVKYVCNINAEKDAFTIVTRLVEDDLIEIVNAVSPYAKECIDNSPYRHRCWVEYRVFAPMHFKDAETILQGRVNGRLFR